MKRPSDDAFTLIELLTVITIICILMAMLFPFILGAKETARKKKAEQDTREIVHAVEQYNVEYAQYPKINPTATPPAGAVPDETAGDIAAGMADRNATLFNTLRDIAETPNTDHVQNPRHSVFVQGKGVSSVTNPRDGFLDAAGGTGSHGSWYDPWGSEYNIVIDSNSDNLLTLDKYYDDFQSANAPRATVGAFSLGKDKKLGKKGDKHYKDAGDVSDDLLSWISN